jgi:hypothetical protein
MPQGNDWDAYDSTNKMTPSSSGKKDMGAYTPEAFKARKEQRHERVKRWKEMGSPMPSEEE